MQPENVFYHLMDGLDFVTSTRKIVYGKIERGTREREGNYVGTCENNGTSELFQIECKLIMVMRDNSPPCANLGGSSASL